MMHYGGGDDSSFPLLCCQKDNIITSKAHSCEAGMHPSSPVPFTMALMPPPSLVFPLQASSLQDKNAALR